MTTQQVADRLVEMGRSGKLDQCYDELFAQDAESHEMAGVPNGSAKGLDNLKKKSEAWARDVKQVHELRISDPVIGGGYFSVSMFIDVEKNDGTRTADAEICVYKVVDGKIAEERFFYTM
ncbi:hypothetical protein CEQ90_11155 [Lewinellaceae bacterium SD302]|nr:hypothetical protein CEQ90_11155 [Lewinellaceae bacterium SD302]